MFQLLAVLALLDKILDADWSWKWRTDRMEFCLLLWGGTEKHCAGFVPRGPAQFCGTLLGPSGFWFVLCGPDSLTWGLWKGPDGVAQALICSAGPWLVPRSPIRQGVLIRPAGPRLVPRGLIRPTGPLFVLRGPGSSHGAPYSSCGALASLVGHWYVPRGPIHPGSWLVLRSPDPSQITLISNCGALARPVGNCSVSRGPDSSNDALVHPTGPWSVPVCWSVLQGPGSSLGARSVPLPWLVLRVQDPGWPRGAQVGSVGLWSVPQGPDWFCWPWFVLRSPDLYRGPWSVPRGPETWQRLDLRLGPMGPTLALGVGSKYMFAPSVLPSVLTLAPSVLGDATLKTFVFSARG